MANALVWFRNDLRIHDHAALVAAIDQAGRSGGRVHCVYVLDPHWFGETSFGFPRIGPFRKRFLRESLLDLNKRLAAIGGRLVVLRGSTAEIIAGYALATQSSTVHCHHEFASEEQSLELRVQSELQRAGIALHVAPAASLYAQQDLPFDPEDLPPVFSKFRRKVEKHCEIRHPLGPPKQIPGPDLSVDVGPDEVDLSQAAEFQTAEFEAAEPMDPGIEAAGEESGMKFVGGETAGLNRIDEYFFQRDRLRVYKQTRNGMLGSDYSSKLSPWLAHGCLSARQINFFVQRYEQQRVKNDSTYWLVFELIWRDYFGFIAAKHGRDLFRVGGLRGMALPWKRDESRFNAWCEGQTGFPLIDANMRELKHTGFMSNRGRQNVASFLTKNLGIDWRMGAEWFESLLIDYDPASNYGNWNYNAGVGNDPRGFRWFNPMKQAANYDPDGHYVRHWCPELSDVPTKFIHSPWAMHSSEQSRSGCQIGVDYPHPIVDLFKSADHHQELYDLASVD